MDRRQKKTREAIFNAFSTLLSQKHYHQITVGEIIALADIGRATFYAHFATKDFLLRELCSELFCHIFDSAEQGGERHRHIFECEAPSSVFLHLLWHLQRNDRHLLDLLVCESNELFLRYFKENLEVLIRDQLPTLADKRPPELPEDFWINHISATLVESIRWWLKNGMNEPPEQLLAYFMAVI